jgi:aminopeptidase N
MYDGIMNLFPRPIPGYHPMTPIRLLLLAMLIASSAHAQSLFTVRDDGERRERTYDVQHYRIEVALDERARTVRGAVTVTLVPLRPALRVVDLDAEALTIESARIAGKDLPFEIFDKTVRVRLNAPASFRDTLKLTLRYSGQPRHGLYFVGPDSSSPSRSWQMWTQGEDMDNHFWFPCYDYPNDMATSEVIATVNDKFTVVSNGRLVSTTEDKARRTRTFHWRQSLPHVSYLIMLAAGEYTVLRGTAESVPLEYYVYPWHVEDAKACFQETPAVLRFFNETIGVRYPWEKYAQVLIDNFIYGGMENTSATSLMDEIIVYDARARVDGLPTSLIAHEMAHQWWGDLVTCADWRHLWLNEGFASYFDELYHEYARGRDEFDYQVYKSQLAGIESDARDGRKPIVSVGSYGTNLYSRSAAVLHMLRFVLGEELFWRAIRGYAAAYRHKPVETNDLIRSIEETTGFNLHWFFNQWVYGAGYPKFGVTPTWSDSADMLAVGVRQTQTLDSLTGVFRTPVDIEIWAGGVPTTHRVGILSADTTFSFPCSSRPEMVIFDKGNWILKELTIHKSIDEWLVQARRAPNPVDRLRALKVIEETDSLGVSLPAVCAIALSDSFHGVREAAVRMLPKLSKASPAAKDSGRAAAVGVLRDRVPGVRSAALSALMRIGGVEAAGPVREALKDSSYTVVSAALYTLAKVDSAGAEPDIIRHLDMPSHRNVVELAALWSLVRVDSGRAHAEAMKRVQPGYPVGVRDAALVQLGRTGRGNPEAAALVAGMLDDDDQTLQATAIRTLGSIGDASVLPRLEAIAADPTHRYQDKAKQAVAAIKIRTQGDVH